MYPRFTRGEYWLLETSVDSWTPMGWLLRPHLGEDLNKKAHGVHRAELLSDLRNLFEQRLIVASKWKDDERVQMMLGLDEIEQAVTAYVPKDAACYDGLCYGLTEKGGAAWEAFAQPDWTKYVGEYTQVESDENSVSDENFVLEFRGMEKYLVERYFTSLRFFIDEGGAEKEISPSYVEWNTTGEWQASYWKRLPSAHVVRACLPSGVNIDMRQNHRTFETIRRSWYNWR